MSRSYEADEKVVQKRRAAGKTSWDEQADPQASFDNFVMRPFLEESLAAIAGAVGPLDGLRDPVTPRVRAEGPAQADADADPRGSPTDLH